VAGEVETASIMNNSVTALGNFVLARPLAILRQTTTQSLPTGTATALTFDTEDIDRDNGHSTSVNPSRYTSQTAGYYYVTAHGSFAGNATGVRNIAAYVNGTQSTSLMATTSSTLTAGTTAHLSFSGIVYLNVSDYLEIFATQTSGGALSTSVTAPHQAFLSVVWVSS
jgi:hypothetical protein